MRQLGIEFISVFGLPPVEFVELAADLGCTFISTGLAPLPNYNPHGYPDWSLLNDRALRQQMTSALRSRGIEISLVEGFFVLPRMDVANHAAALDAAAELGAKRVNTLGLDPDSSRTFDQFSKLATMAAERGLATTLEFVPGTTVGDLRTAVAAVRHVGRADFKVLIDVMHLVRSGSGASDLAALSLDTIDYVQLCDVPLRSKYSQYAEEAKYERMKPGDGELPLLDILEALPAQLPIGLEIPQRSLAEAGEGPRERLGKCVAATHRLLARLER